ncbi:MAG: CYTH domain-containing protein [Rhodothermaceae bacterium]|nr:MAG: CYTH domain-containing protein [Rhodothermaceae bacterium]
MLEIERKFLIDRLPEQLETFPHEPVRQGYVAADPNGTVVRLRQKGDRFYLTVKSAGERARIEREVLLAADQFEALWPATEGRRLEKTRYYLPHGAYTIELDVYHGALEGLFTAEVEFESHAAAEAYAPPAWFGREVTYDPRYKNLQLATRGRPPA